MINSECGTNLPQLYSAVDRDKVALPVAGSSQSTEWKSDWLDEPVGSVHEVSYLTARPEHI
jgi:hypothetical protein